MSTETTLIQDKFGFTGRPTLCCIAIMISITTVIQIHIQIQADSVVSDTNGFINFWLWSMATQGERHNS